MEIEYDAAKDKANIKKHGVSFEEIELFDWETVVSELDERKDYGEPRILSYGMIGLRLYVLIWTKRNTNIRIISLRKANKKEKKKYEKEEKTSVY